LGNDLTSVVAAAVVRVKVVRVKVVRVKVMRVKVVRVKVVRVKVMRVKVVRVVMAAAAVMCPPSLRSENFGHMSLVEFLATKRIGVKLFFHVFWQ
jgi:hypothetical protein